MHLVVSMHRSHLHTIGCVQVGDHGVGEERIFCAMEHYILYITLPIYIAKGQLLQTEWTESLETRQIVLLNHRMDTVIIQSL